MLHLWVDPSPGSHLLLGRHRGRRRHVAWEEEPFFTVGPDGESVWFASNPKGSRSAEGSRFYGSLVSGRFGPKFRNDRPSRVEMSLGPRPPSCFRNPLACNGTFGKKLSIFIYIACVSWRGLKASFSISFHYYHARGSFYWVWYSFGAIDKNLSLLVAIRLNGRC